MMFRSRFFLARVFAALFFGAPAVPPVPTITPSERVVAVEAQNRVAVLDAQAARRTTVAAHSRIIAVAAQSRVVTVEV